MWTMRGAGAGCFASILAMGLAACGPQGEQAPAPSAAPADDADVIIVGAGLAGLSAAIDAASAGARVIVLDMNSVFGGHGIQSGGVAIVGSPLQEAAGYHDTPDQAYHDWMEWTIDGNPEWTRFYVDNSRRMIYDWITPMGVTFDTVRPSHGNSIPRFHMTHRRGLNLLRPLYLEALRYSNIDWRWNVFAEHLIKENGRIVGVRGRNLRGSVPVELRAGAVVLATGGFESNVDMITENWRDDLPTPGRVWGMSGQNSRGYGHRMAEEAGAALVRLDHQYNGYAGLPNALGLDDERGFPGGNPKSIWINKDGVRFVTEGGVDRYVFPVVMRQQPEGHWSIFDENDKLAFGILSPHFVTPQGPDRDKIQRMFVDNPEVTAKADTLEGLAREIGVPPESLVATVERYNEQVRNGESTEVDGLAYEDPPPEFTIDTPPFYATKLYPIGNKSAGGVAIDLGTRALDSDGAPVPGLYAAGELTGSAGMDGSNGLDGMFTGPSILTGRVAGQTVVSDLQARGRFTPVAFTRAEQIEVPAEDPGWVATLGPDDVRAMLATSRDGYWHFERVHNLVLERGYACTSCHSGALPFAPLATREAKAAQAEVCDNCHLAPAGLVAEGAQSRPAAAPMRD